MSSQKLSALFGFVTLCFLRMNYYQDSKFLIDLVVSFNFGWFSYGFKNRRFLNFVFFTVLVLNSSIFFLIINRLEMILLFQFLLKLSCTCSAKRPLD